MTPEKKYLTPEETAEMIGMAKQTIYKMVHQKKIPYYKVGGKLIRFEQGEIIDWLEGKKIDEVKEKPLKGGGDYE